MLIANKGLSFIKSGKADVFEISRTMDGLLLS